MGDLGRPAYTPPPQAVRPPGAAAVERPAARRPVVAPPASAIPAVPPEARWDWDTGRSTRNGLLAAVAIVLLGAATAGALLWSDRRNRSDEAGSAALPTTSLAPVAVAPTEPPPAPATVAPTTSLAPVAPPPPAPPATSATTVAPAAAPTTRATAPPPPPTTTTTRAPARTSPRVTASPPFTPVMPTTSSSTTSTTVGR